MAGRSRRRQPSRTRVGDFRSDADDDNGEKEREETKRLLYVALTRGGKYRNTPADTQVPYLKMVFTFLGLTDVHFVYAEGLSMGPDAEQNAIASAHEQIEEAVAA